MEHELKIYKKYFDEIVNGNKSFEIRNNDRNFMVDDIVILKEWDNIKYSRREIYARIKYIFTDNFIGLEKGYVAFSIEVVDIVN